MTSDPLSAGEEKILTSIGYIVARWNYAEHCARGLLRRYVSGASINDADHLQLSRRNARWIEERLRDEILPAWADPGAQFLARLVEAYASARAHRNFIVHGVWMTLDGQPPQAIMLPTMPVAGRSPIPVFLTDDHLRKVGSHLHELAVYAQQVMVGFDPGGARARNGDGTCVLKELPSLPLVMPPVSIRTS